MHNYNAVHALFSFHITLRVEAADIGANCRGLVISYFVNANVSLTVIVHTVHCITHQVIRSSSRNKTTHLARIDALASWTSGAVKHVAVLTVDVTWEGRTLDRTHLSALLLRLKVVLIPSAASVDKRLAHSSVCVVEPA